MSHIHELYDFTVSAFILHPNKPKLCLLKHTKLNKWFQPGGHIELNEDPLQALEHELFEETGLILDDCTIIEPADQPNVKGQKTLPLPHLFNVHDYNGGHKHIDMEFLVRSNTETFSPQENESQRIEWFNKDQIRILHSEGDMFDGTLDICEWLFSNHM